MTDKMPVQQKKTCQVPVPASQDTQVHASQDTQESLRAMIGA